jgi:hypothetical protein
MSWCQGEYSCLFNYAAIPRTGESGNDSRRCKGGFAATLRQQQGECEMRVQRGSLFPGEKDYRTSFFLWWSIFRCDLLTFQMPMILVFYVKGIDFSIDYNSHETNY